MLLNFWFLVSGRPLVRLPSSSPDSSFRFPVSGFRFWFQLAALASLFPGSGFGGLSCDCLAPTGFRFPFSHSGLDLLRSLLNFQFQVSAQALVRSPAFSPDSHFIVLISDYGLDLLHSLLNFQNRRSGMQSLESRIQSLEHGIWKSESGMRNSESRI